QIAGQDLHGVSADSCRSEKGRRGDCRVPPFRATHPRFHRGQRQDLSCSIGGGTAAVTGKKTTTSACDKASAQLELQVQRMFADRRTSGRLDLEAAEVAIRSTMHRTGADAITELLRFSAPDDQHRSIPCPCGHVAGYQEMRSRPILTV